MIIPSFFLPAPGRLFLPGCAIAAGLLAVSSPVIAAPHGKNSAPSSVTSSTAPQTLRVGKTTSYSLPKLSVVRVEEGFANVFWEAQNETLTVKALNAGAVKIRIESPHRAPQIVRLNLVETQPASHLVTTEGLLQIVERAPLGAGNLDVAPLDANSNTNQNPAFAASQQTPGTSLVSPDLGAATAGNVTAGGAGTSGAFSTVPNTVPNSITGAMPNSALTNNEIANNGIANNGIANGTFAGASPLLAAPVGVGTIPAPLAPSLPVLGTTTGSVRANNPVNVSAGTSAGVAPRISPVLPAPSNGARANVAYRTTARLPQGVGAGNSRQGIDVTQGLARLLSFPSNILAVFFSDPNVMDARAINARTIAVTGVGAGPSTLAVFTSRFPGDAVGRANIYRIQTLARGGQMAIEVRNPRLVERAIVAALGDPRVRTAIISLPDGSLAARLSGTVRSEAEVQAALTTASFFVPRVISSLYADTNAPTLEAVLSGASNATPESNLQEDLRRITGNSSIELVSLPSGLAFKAEVNSVDEAQALLRVLPGLNQQVIPFIVIRGQDPASSPYYNSTVPLLNGEDRQLTQKLHDVTGITTVYAVRASSNGLACYGTVRTRTEYDTVRRFMNVMAQSSSPPATQGASQGGATLRPLGLEGALPAYDGAGGYLRPLGLQMFVRITDVGQSVIRKVTVETSVVEISRTALRNLGVEVGSVSLLSENVTGGTSVQNTTGAVTTSAPIINRTIDPTFLQGAALGGTGFVGGQSFGNINPFRARLNALMTNGDARLLARPNVTAVEGASAQITIGGERPVPRAVATQGAVGTQVEFRRFGVIITMRPTVTGDNTILLQIRADITQPDRTYEINLGGALIPGETVRSINTTINVRPGDTVVMGGLITNEKRQSTSKVPILGDLPIIGSLFRSRRFENNETELAIFMSPHIDSMPAGMEEIENLNRVPALPLLPSRQESNAILFEPTTRSGG
ncbi:Type II secretory pathway component GspD/PulD (secretin) [Abditibacterium utsteinense]|uniref:Type II secretory pathway component GspD/PulD (Secretin) n=1 Tax=Abditibacterium utsteinense TaxID=1960156 RepID=A0A2S8STY3_9BACT|nr:pilus assembly protein N-terminal domain-containing protein [Abditibacterium utsteinense]PQV64238.1 Type II secretory pathway component GspD/PulD (secretin) [Abditibacterium utsteinense]